MMTTNQALGTILVAVPFIVATIWMIKEDGWKVATGIWGATVAVIVCFAVGSYLLGNP